MANGVNTTNLEQLDLADGFVANYGGKTGVQSVEALAVQLAQKEPLSGPVNALTFVFPSYANMAENLTSPQTDGEVVKAGRHTYDVDSDSPHITINGVGLRLRQNDSGLYDARGWGAVFDAAIATRVGTDNYSVLQDMVDTLYSEGGGTIFIGGLGFVATAVSVLPDVSFEGFDNALCGLIAQVDEHRVFTTHTLARSGKSFVRNMMIRGYADQNASQGTHDEEYGINSPDGRGARLGPFDELTYDNVRCSYTRQMGLTGDATVARALNCKLDHIFRDGINLTNCKRVVTRGNVGKYLADDFIALHLDVSYDGETVGYEPTIVTGNECSYSQGIVVLGARNSIISNNTGRFIRGRWIKVGIDAFYGEGAWEALAVTITGNTATDIIDGRYFGGGAQCTLIQLDFPEEAAGTDTHVTDSIPGTPDDTGAFTLPEVQWDYPDPKSEAGRPRGASRGVVVTGNTGMQTMGGLTTFSDAGYGSMWDTTGLTDIALTGTIHSRATNNTWAGQGVLVKGAFDGLIIGNNYFSGFNIAVSFASYLGTRKNLSVQNNVVSRCRQGILFTDPGSAVTVEGLITGNTFDLDPFFEASDRAADGVWSNTGASDHTAIVAANHRGLVIKDNALKNAKKLVHGSNSQFIRKGNTYYGDPESGSGVGLYQDLRENDVIWLDSDPASETYLEVLSPVTTSDAVNTIPSSGYFVAGQEVKKRVLTVDSNSNVLTGWLRLTTGSGHVSGTDWAPMYVSSVSSAA